MGNSFLPDVYRPAATAHFRGNWDDARCQGHDMSTDGRTAAQIRDLKLRCVGCPVIKRCGQWAIRLTGREDVNEVAGGMTREERAQVRTVLNARRTVREEKAA